MLQSTLVRSGATVLAPCPVCGDERFLDDGAPVCPTCTCFVPTDKPPPPDRDAAFAKVHRLLRWYANRYVRAGRAGHGTTAEEFVQEAAVVFYQTWHWFDGDPNHLSTFVGFTVRRTAQNLRKQNPAPAGASLATFDHPDELTPDRPHHTGPEFDELDRLKAALGQLEPQRRAEVLSFYGVFGHRRVTGRELADRATGPRRTSTAATERVRKALPRLAAYMAKRA